MRRLLILGVAWTAVVLAVVMFWPTSLPVLGCARLVVPPAGCLEQLAQANERLWWTQTLPMLVFFASGYVVIAAIAVRRRRRAGG